MENLESAVPADIKEVRAELKETESFWLTPKVCNTDIIVNDATGFKVRRFDCRRAWRISHGQSKKHYQKS